MVGAFLLAAAIVGVPAGPLTWLGVFPARRVPVDGALQLGADPIRRSSR